MPDAERDAAFWAVRDSSDQLSAYQVSDGTTTINLHPDDFMAYVRPVLRRLVREIRANGWRIPTEPVGAVRVATTLTTFLLARVGEAEERARKATGEKWRWVDPGGSVKQALVTDGWNPQVPWVVLPVATGDAYPLAQDAAHIAYWDPARVLAWCESMRKLIELHAPDFVHGPDDVYGERIGPCKECSCSGALASTDCLGSVEWPCRTVLTLATLFSDHPEYEDSWRP